MIIFLLAAILLVLLMVFFPGAILITVMLAVCSGAYWIWGVKAIMWAIGIFAIMGLAMWGDVKLAQHSKPLDKTV
jgi:hypothetical protein